MDPEYFAPARMREIINYLHKHDWFHPKIGESLILGAWHFGRETLSAAFV